MMMKPIIPPYRDIEEGEIIQRKVFKPMSKRDLESRRQSRDYSLFFSQDDKEKGNENCSKKENSLKKENSKIPKPSSKFAFLAQIPNPFKTKNVPNSTRTEPNEGPRGNLKGPKGKKLVHTNPKPNSRTTNDARPNPNSSRKQVVATDPKPKGVNNRCREEGSEVERQSKAKKLKPTRTEEAPFVDDDDLLLNFPPIPQDHLDQIWAEFVSFQLVDRNFFDGVPEIE